MLTVEQLKQEVERLGFFELIRFSEWMAQYRASRKVHCVEEKQNTLEDIPQTQEQPTTSNEDFSIDYSKLDTKKTALGHYKLHYKGTNGEVSCREINLRNVFRKNEIIYFSAYCHLRGKIKTFRVDRIILLEDLSNNMV
jgi:hypothetical protein